MSTQPQGGESIPILERGGPGGCQCLWWFGSDAGVVVGGLTIPLSSPACRANEETSDVREERGGVPRTHSNYASWPGK